MPSWSETQLTVSQAAALAAASRALWLATLSLMTAFMNTHAPAHRYLIARRIARNFDTLGEQECFSGDCRSRFRKLGVRWQDRATEFSPQRQQPRAHVLESLSRLFRRTR